MAIFVVLPLVPMPSLAQKIAEIFPTDFYRLSDTQFLVSTTGTTVELCERLGINSGEINSTIVFATSGYYGRAPNVIWEWIKAKLEST